MINIMRGFCHSANKDQQRLTVCTEHLVYPCNLAPWGTLRPPPHASTTTTQSITALSSPRAYILALRTGINLLFPSSSSPEGSPRSIGLSKTTKTPGTTNKFLLQERSLKILTIQTRSHEQTTLRLLPIPQSPNAQFPKNLPELKLNCIVALSSVLSASWSVKFADTTCRFSIDSHILQVLSTQHKPLQMLRSGDLHGMFCPDQTQSTYHYSCLFRTCCMPILCSR